MTPRHKQSPSFARGASTTLGNPRLTLFCQGVMLLLAIGIMSSCSMNGSANPPATAKRVDLSRYTGRWYEMARLPMPFQKDDEAAIAEYGANPDGTLSVHNIAIRPDGSQHGIRGSAKVLNPPDNTKLAVRFSTWFGPLIPVPKEGNYWVLHVDDSYQEAIVGTPDRKYLWILSRTPTIPESRYAALVNQAEALGFDGSRLIRPARQHPTQVKRPVMDRPPASLSHSSFQR